MLRRCVWAVGVRTAGRFTTLFLGISLEQPVLGLGLLGFPATLLQQAVSWAGQSQPGWPLWRAIDPVRADAWMIYGPAVEWPGRDELVIRHPAGTDERITLRRTEVDRPLAFATPLPKGFASTECFDAGSEKSVLQRLQRFEAWLRPLRTQFALGAQLVDRVTQYKGGVVHVTHKGKLLAVIDFERWVAGMFILARPVDLAMADWIRRPARANDIPTTFIRLPVHQLMWLYAARTSRDLLPSRYRTRTIHLRRIPRVSVQGFDDLHRELMDELVAAPGTLDALAERTGAPLVEVAHHVAALFFAGGLTTDAENARLAETRVRHDWLALQLAPGGLGNDGRAVAASNGAVSEFGVPSSLLHDSGPAPLGSTDLP